MGINNKYIHPKRPIGNDFKCQNLRNEKLTNDYRML